MPPEPDEGDLAAYDFPLDADLIAQHPSRERGGSRLCVVDREQPATRAPRERAFIDLPWLLREGDLLVLNDTRVRAARLTGVRTTGGRVNLLLLDSPEPGRWRAMLTSRRPPTDGETLTLADGALTMTVTGREPRGTWLLDGPASWADIEPHGSAPLPPYIKRDGPKHRTRDLERYQTTYAREGDAVAAPTAGLHFTPHHLRLLEQRGVELCRVRLDVGAGTFLPVKTDRIDAHTMHAERFQIDQQAADQLGRAVADQRRIVAVGTTSARALETLAREQTPPFAPCEGETRLFLRPPDTMRLTGALITNFHLPKSTLLMLVSAMAGRERILRAYDWARQRRFRFHSYGDAMLIV